MNLKNLTQPELAVLLKELGQPAFRAKQVYTWLHKGVRSYEEMTNLPKALRDTLAQQYPIDAPVVVKPLTVSKKAVDSRKKDNVFFVYTADGDNGNFNRICDRFQHFLRHGLCVRFR